MATRSLFGALGLLAVAVLAAKLFSDRIYYAKYVSLVKTANVVLDSELQDCLPDLPAEYFGNSFGPANIDGPLNVYGQVGTPTAASLAEATGSWKSILDAWHKIFGEPEDLHVDLAYSVRPSDSLNGLEMQDISVTLPLPFHSKAVYELSCQEQRTGDFRVFRKHSPMMLTQNYREPPTTLVPRSCLGEDGIISVRMANDPEHTELAAMLTGTEFRAVHWIPGSGFTTPVPLAMYLPKRGFVPGETVEVHMHARDTAAPAVLEIHRAGNPLSALRLEVGDLQQTKIDAYSYRDGLDWPVTMSFEIPQHFQSGYYVAVLSQGKARASFVFVVKPPEGETPRAVIIAATNTWNAYNDWGGGGFYENKIGDTCLNTDYARMISSVRPDRGSTPVQALDKYSHLSETERTLALWLSRNGIEFGVYTDDDLHRDPDLLKDRPLVILPSHPEYYTETMYDQIAAHVENGGDIVSLGANIMYYRTSRTETQMEIRANGRLHDLEPVFGGLWSQHLDRPPARIFGAEYDARDWATWAPYEVIEPTHPIFAETGLEAGDLFGPMASGLEMDLLQEDTGLEPTLLATGTNPSGYGASMLFVEHPSGSKVFSTGSISFVFALEKDERLGILLNNVFDLMEDDG